MNIIKSLWKEDPIFLSLVAVFLFFVIFSVTCFAIAMLLVLTS